MGQLAGFRYRTVRLPTSDLPPPTSDFRPLTSDLRLPTPMKFTPFVVFHRVNFLHIQK